MLHQADGRYVRPDRHAVRVFAGAAEKLGLGEPLQHALGAVAQHAPSLVTTLPRPAAWLLTEVLALLGEFEGACRVWQVKDESQTKN